MERIEFNLLRAEIDAQVKEIDKIYKEIEDRQQGAEKSRPVLESLGYQLHNLYCAFEDLFKIVAQCFENQVKDISQYHKELLRRLSLPVEGVRPRLVSEESYREMDELRVFRHFFRHAYSYELRYEKVKIPLDSAGRLQGFYKRDIAHFLDAVEEELNSLSCD